MNLFLALLLASFGSNVLTETEVDEDDNKFAVAIGRIQRFFRFVTNSILHLFCRRKTEENKANTNEIVIFNQVGFIID